MQIWLSRPYGPGTAQPLRLWALPIGKVPLIGRGRQMIVFSFAIIGVAIYPLSASFGLLGLAAGLVVIGLLEGPADVAFVTLRQGRAGAPELRCRATGLCRLH